MAKPTIAWPEKLVISGQMSFPLTSLEDIEALKQRRLEKKQPKPKFADKIGGYLLLTDAGLEKAVRYLTETYLPFAGTLQKVTNGDKGIDPDLIKDLLKQAKARDWSEKNFPIRDLTEKDKENLGEDSEFVAKIRFNGPYGDESIEKRAIVLVDGKQRAVELNELDDYGLALPSSRSDESVLYWGAGWKFRVPMRFNAFDSASVGVSAYADSMFLLPHLGMPVSGGDDAIVLEDGEDPDFQ